jgi:hypothetical protein
MIFVWNTRKKGGSGGFFTDPGVDNVLKGINYYFNNTLRTGTYSPAVISSPGKVSGSMPNLSSALLDWFQPMIFTKNVKSVVDFKNFETPTSYNFKGVWQPFTIQQLSMKPEGQRQWRWYTLHAETGLELFPDDVVGYNSVQYRVMQKNDYTLNGYIEYHLIDDYTGSGPA